MTKAIELRDVSLSLNQKQILNGINLTVQKGTIYGFLGPNGAGKTTLMKVILNLLHTNQGLVEIFEKPITNKSYEYLRHIGSIIETPVFYNKLTVYENMKLHCDYLGIYDESKIDKKLKLVDMTQARDKKVKELSLGMKQRLAIARTLISEPELLILDEPINGLDPFGIKEIRELLIQINREFGTTIFISSHIISEIESMCDVIGFINKGQFIKEMSMQEIVHESKKYIEVVTEDVTSAATIIDTALTDNFKVISENTLRIYDPSVIQKTVMQQLVSSDIAIESISEQSGDLEDYFVKLMNEGEK